jgi:hypothetical protein
MAYQKREKTQGCGSGLPRIQIRIQAKKELTELFQTSIFPILCASFRNISPSMQVFILLHNWIEKPPAVCIERV